MARFAAHGLVTHAPPIVAVNANADPHFGPSSAARPRDPPRRFRPARFVGQGVRAPTVSTPISPGSRSPATRFPTSTRASLQIVADARDATVDLVQRRVAAGEAVSGREADRAARSVIEARRLRRRVRPSHRPFDRPRGAWHRRQSRLARNARRSHADRQHLLLGRAGNLSAGKIRRAQRTRHDDRKRPRPSERGPAQREIVALLR